MDQWTLKKNDDPVSTGLSKHIVEGVHHHRLLWPRCIFAVYNKTGYREKTCNQDPGYRLPNLTHHHPLVNLTPSPSPLWKRNTLEKCQAPANDSHDAELPPYSTLLQKNTTYQIEWTNANLCNMSVPPLTTARFPDTIKYFFFFFHA